jgi:hypothetical protein
VGTELCPLVQEGSQTGVNYPALLAPSRGALGRFLRTGLSVDCRTCRPVPMLDVASMYADGSRAGVFVPASLLRTGFKGGCGTDAPEAGWSAHSTLIPGGLKWVRLRRRDVPSPPSSGPVYGGPCIGSILAPMHHHVIRSHGAKLLRMRFLPSLLTRFARSLRLGPPRYRVVKVVRASLACAVTGPDTAARIRRPFITRVRTTR